MSFADKCFESGRRAGAHERATRIATGCPFAAGSAAERYWWNGYQTGMDGFQRSPLA